MTMRMTLLLAPYRSFAVRGRLSMTMLATTLLFAIGILLAVSAGSAHASFLAAEARNLATLRADGDFGLVVVALLMFGVSIATAFGMRRFTLSK